MVWDVDDQDEVFFLEGTMWKEGIWNWVCGAVRDRARGAGRKWGTCPGQGAGDGGEGA